MLTPLRSTRQHWRRLLTLALACPLFGALQPARAATMFSYLSSPYSWVGGGETVSIGPEGGFAFTAKPLTNGMSIAINDFATNPDFQATRWWQLDLSTANDQALTVGSYTGATRHPFNVSPFSDPATPGLSFTGNGRGNNALTGSFDVLEANFADDGSVLSFAADFVQYDEGWQSWWNKGAIRINSNLPIALTPEPINEAELIKLGYLPDPDQVLPEEPASVEEPIVEIPVEETPIEEPPFIVDEPFYGEWPNEYASSCMLSNADESLSRFIREPCPLPIPDLEPTDLGSEIVWFFSSGSSSEMVVPKNYYNYRTLELSPAGSPVATPGPLPVAAALAGWQSSRRLRRRCRNRGEQHS